MAAAVLCARDDVGGVNVLLLLLLLLLLQRRARFCFSRASPAAARLFALFGVYILSCGILCTFWSVYKLLYNVMALKHDGVDAQIQKCFT